MHHCLPVHVTRSLAIYAHFIIDADTPDAARQKGGLVGNDANRDKDPWLSMIATFRGFNDGTWAAQSRGRCTVAMPAAARIRRVGTYLDGSVGARAITTGYPFAQCMRCLGRGHAHTRGINRKTSKIVKHRLDLQGGGGILNLSKQAVELRLGSMQAPARTRENLKQFHGYVKEGCPATADIWEHRDVLDIDQVKKVSTALLAGVKEAARPRETRAYEPPLGLVPAYFPEGCGVRAFNANGSTTTTTDMRTWASTIEIPSQASWMLNNAVTAAACALAVPGNFTDHWGESVRLLFARLLPKRCLWCGGGGHYYSQCLAWKQHQHADWVRNSGGAQWDWLRPQAIYHSPGLIMNWMVTESIRVYFGGSAARAASVPIMTQQQVQAF